MKIIHKQSDTKGAFEAFNDEGKMGEMTYSKAGDSMIIIDHTFVDEKFRGQNIARQLLDTTVAFVRENRLKIKPLCPYAKRVMEKETERFKDVLV